MKAAIEREQCQSRLDTVEREQARPKVKLYHASTMVIKKPGKVRYRLNYAKLGICKDGIIGELSVYSLNHREPEKPMHIQLHRSDRLNRKM